MTSENDHPIYSEKDVAYMVGFETERQAKLVEEHQQKMADILDNATAEYARLANRALWIGIALGVSFSLVIFFCYKFLI